MTKKEAKNFDKNVYDVLERRGRLETERHMTFFHEQIELRVTPS